MQNQLLCDDQVRAALYLKWKLKTYFLCHLCRSFVSLQITHMADFHQITSISITRIPLITASPQTDKQKATVSLKVLGASEVCYSTCLHWVQRQFFFELVLQTSSNSTVSVLLVPEIRIS